MIVQRKLGYSFLVMLLLITLTGCWSRKELNDLAIAMGMAIDRTEQGYRVTVQVVNPGEIALKQGSTLRSPVSVHSETGETLFEAIRKITKVSPRKIYFAHLRILVVSEEIARDGMTKVLDFISREPEFRTDFYLTVANDQPAGDVLKILTLIEKIPANKLFRSLETSEKAWAPTVAMQLDEFIADILSDGKNPVLTGIEIIGDKSVGQTRKNMETVEPTRLKYTSVAVFKKDKLIGWLNEEESKGYNYILGNVKSTVGHVTCPQGGKVLMEVVRTTSNIKGSVAEGKPKISVHLTVEENVAEANCSIDLLNPKTIEKLQAKAETTIKSFMEKSIKKVQDKYQADIFGFGEAIRRENPVVWNKFRKNWDSEFAKLPVEIQVDVKIRRVGTTNQSLQKEIQE